MNHQLEVAQMTYHRLPAKTSHLPWWDGQDYAFVVAPVIRDDELSEFRDGEFIFARDAHLYIFDRAVSNSVYPESQLSISIHEMGLDEVIGDMVNFHQQVQRVLKGEDGAFLTLWEIIGQTRYTEDGNEYDEEIHFKGVVNATWLGRALYTNEYFLNERERTIKPIMLGWDSDSNLTIRDADDLIDHDLLGGMAEGDFPF